MCFKDPSATASRKQKKTGNQTQREEARPNRVIVATGRSVPPEAEMRTRPEGIPLPATQPNQTVRDGSVILGDDELEPWSMGAVIRRTSMLQAANEKKKAEEEAARYQQQIMASSPSDIPTTKSQNPVLVEETGNGEMASTPNMASTRDGEGTGVRATMVFGLPTTKTEPRVDLNAIAEEAELRRITEENNALAAKGSHSGKYGGAIGANPAYSQRAPPVSLQERDTRKSGWARACVSGSFAAAMDEPYYDYEAGAASPGRSPVGSPYASPYGYAGKKNSPYAYVSGPAN